MEVVGEQEVKLEVAGLIGAAALPPIVVSFQAQVIYPTIFMDLK